MRMEEVKVASAAAERLSAAAAFETEVTLSSEEARALVKWIRSEKYRNQRR